MKLIRVALIALAFPHLQLAEKTKKRALTHPRLAAENEMADGKLPLKLGVEFQYMPQRPDALGQEFNIRLVIAPILPSPFGK